MKKLAILGAGGQGRVIAEIAELNHFDEIVFFDDSWVANDGSKYSCPQLPWQVVGDTDCLSACHKEYDACVVGIGHNQIRFKKQNLLKQAGARMICLIHPSAVVSRYAELGEGSVVMANAVVNPFVKVGKACILNTGATIDHDCIIKDAAHVCPGANLGGGVEVGAHSWIGIGACVKEYVKVGSNVRVGGGAAVVNDVSDNQTVVGIPAKSLIDRSC